MEMPDHERFEFACKGDAPEELEKKAPSITRFAHEENEKRWFVEDHLDRVVTLATRGAVCDLHYDHAGPFEFVKFTVDHRNAPTEIYEVNVTGDSLWAMAKDVMRAVGNRYE